MNFKKVKKLIASTLVVFSLFSICNGTLNSYASNAYASEVQTRDWDDYYDDMEIFKGNISIEEITNYRGRKAVTITVPSGINVHDVDVDGEPHDGIDEVVIGNKIIIYGLRENFNYNYLRLVVEDYMDIEYVYNINPFTINGSVNGGVTNGPVADINRPSNVNTQELSNYLNTIYMNVFGRPGDANGLNYWINNLSSGKVDLESLFKNLLVEDEFLIMAPTTQNKITKLYTGIFQREPDGEGYNFWVSKYNEKLNQYRNEKAALVDIIDEMTDGKEFKEISYRLGLN